MERLGCKETVSPLEVPKTRSAQGSLRESPCQRSAGVHRVVLQIRDHGGDRTFDKGPSFGGRLKLIPSKLPQAQVLVRDVLEKRSLCKVRQCCKTMVRSGFPQAENNINAAKLLPPACLHPILETRTLCAVLWIFRECSLRPRAVPFRRRWPGCAYAGPAPQHWRPPGPWRQTTPELGPPGTVALRLPLQLAGSYPGGFLERNFEALLSECTKKGLSHTKAFRSDLLGIGPAKIHRQVVDPRICSRHRFLVEHLESLGPSCNQVLITIFAVFDIFQKRAVPKVWRVRRATNVWTAQIAPGSNDFRWGDGRSGELVNSGPGKGRRR